MALSTARSLLAVSCVLAVVPATAGPRDMYRDKRYPFLELRLHQDAAAAISCVLGRIYVAQYPAKTSSRYSGYYYSPQIVAYPDRTVRVGWYDSGNMVTPPGRIYDWLLLTPASGGSRVAVNLRGGGGKPAAADANWLMQLARGCAASGSSDGVNVWPRT